MDQLLRTFPYIVFFIIITIIFYQVLVTTKNVLIFVAILFAFYVIFRYVMTTVEYIYDNKTLPIVTKNDLDRYSLEQGVELREYQENYEDFTENYCGCSGGGSDDSDAEY